MHMNKPPSSHSGYTTYNLLLAVLLTRDEIHSFKVTEIDVPTENIHVQQLANVLFLLVAVQVALCCSGCLVD